MSRRRDLSADSDVYARAGRRGCPFLRPSRRWQISRRPRKAVGRNLWPLTYKYIMQRTREIYIHTCIIYCRIDVFRDTRTRYVFIIILCNKVLVHDCSVSFFFSPSLRCILYYSFYDPSHTNRRDKLVSLLRNRRAHICSMVPTFSFLLFSSFFFYHSHRTCDARNTRV